ncbi:MAG: TonB-dependent receptor plug domain-containing protein [Bacteroidota bacterium]
MRPSLLLVLCLLMPGALLTAQNFTGQLQTEDEAPIVGARIYNLDTRKGKFSSSDGTFTIKASPNHQLIISSLGYKADTLTLTSQMLSGSEPYRIDLKEDNVVLNEVLIEAKSPATEVREKAYAVEVIESRGFKNLTTNANAILGRVSGVNIRESGGLGSAFTLSLNGLSGNQVRIFLDGVPMDYFGTSLSLNNFAANIIERIEVYKGVVPVHLSSDALGGAINVVTNNTTNNYLDASYSLGSFNTHIASLNAQFRLPKSGFTQRIKSFYNKSDNNYQVPVKLVDFTTGKEADEETWVERFHDGYESRMGWYELGFTGTKWADELMVGALYSDNYKELQQPANAIGQAKVPYGEVASEEEKTIFNFKYRKNGLLGGRLSLNAFGVGVFGETISRDTASVRYDWFGTVTPKIDNSTGEVENRKTLLSLDTENYLGNINAEYAFNPTQSATLNYSMNDFSLQGSDPFKGQNNTQFSQPNEVTKQVMAASFTNTFLRDALRATVFGKYYDYEINSLETNYQGTELIPFNNEKSYTGAGIATTLFLNDFQFKLSYERAVRFPEVVELFGDGLNIVASPSILPETSNNYNLGIILNKNISLGSLYVSLNSFLRDANDFIIPVVQGIKVFHINNGIVLSRGLDFSVGLNHRDNFVFSLNGTYLDLRDNNPWKNGQVGIENTLYRARIPNVPYLFGNFTFSYRNRDLFSERDSYSISVNQNYTHEFFYRWEVLASTNKSVVPSQYSTNLDFVYSMNEEKYNVSFSVVNLFDSRLYDNFQQLRPGRNFNVKLRLFIN